MKKKWYFIAPAAILGIFLFLFVGGQVVMLLWNWLLPPLLGWHLITFWQALGILALCRILFGGHGHGWGGHGGRNFRDRMKGRCGNMTPEERDRFREGIRATWGAPPASDTKA
jgi:hypothetical protein